MTSVDAPGGTRGRTVAHVISPRVKFSECYHLGCHAIPRMSLSNELSPMTSSYVYFFALLFLYRHPQAPIKTSFLSTIMRHFLLHVFMEKNGLNEENS